MRWKSLALRYETIERDKDKNLHMFKMPCNATDTAFQSDLLVFSYSLIPYIEFTLVNDGNFNVTNKKTHNIVYINKHLTWYHFILPTQQNLLLDS